MSTMLGTSMSQATFEAYCHPSPSSLLWTRADGAASTGAAPLPTRLTNTMSHTFVRNEPQGQAQHRCGRQDQCTPRRGTGTPGPSWSLHSVWGLTWAVGCHHMVTFGDKALWRMFSELCNTMREGGVPRKPHRSSCDQALKRVAKL